jgi:type VI secretion system protein ImpJ
MQHLKRVGWQLGQPLLPLHLVAQEDSLLAHLSFYSKNQGLPIYGIGLLKWDDTLLFQGVVSINKLTAVFPSGEVVDIPENGKISIFDLNKVGKNQVAVYLHLLKDSSDQEMYLDDQQEEEEKVTFVLNQLTLSTEGHTFSTKASFKLAEFEKDVENRWKLSENFAPPLLTIHEHPFLMNKLFRLRTIIEGFQKELEQESATGKVFEQRTIETKLCLIEVAKLRRFLLNVDRNLLSHPYYLYEKLSDILNTLALVYIEHPDLNLIPYQHEKLAPLFSKLIEFFVQYLKPKSERLSSLQFEKRDNCYVSEKLPQELREANDIYLIAQPVDPKQRYAMEGLKLASYSRLSNIYRFALTGIPLMKLESAPFNNNFSKYASVYKLDKDLEWDHAITEGRIAFSVHDINEELQAFLYWR